MSNDEKRDGGKKLTIMEINHQSPASPQSTIMHYVQGRRSNNMSYEVSETYEHTSSDKNPLE